MKTVPSLVASSTVGVAAAGLALGKPNRSTTRPSSKKRKVTDLAETHTNPPHPSSPSPRQATSSTQTSPDSRSARRPDGRADPPIIHQRPLTSRAETQNSSSGRRLSVVRSREFPSVQENSGEEHKRDSISSRGSWMKRLSTISHSQNNSPRSSIGPDSPSLQISHGSVAPILSSPDSHTPAQTLPNKIVKRSTSGRAVSGPLLRSRSQTQAPILRRPATSHQRTVTLQQQLREDLIIPSEPTKTTPPKPPHSIPSSQSSTPDSFRPWRPYFDSRLTRITKERVSGSMNDGSMPNVHSTSKRVLPEAAPRPILVKPGMINQWKDQTPVYYMDSMGAQDNDEDVLEPGNESVIPSTEEKETPQKRARRSLSMHFSSPASWVTRSGSLRGSKRNIDGGKRHSSAPGSTIPTRATLSAHGPISNRSRQVMDRAVFQRETHTSGDHPSPADPFVSSFQARSRNSSSPLPPLSRLSSFNVDLARLAPSSSSSSAARRTPTSPALQTNTTASSMSSTNRNSSNSPSCSYPIHSKRASEVADQASTLVGSDNDARGFTSGDEDDLDFRSETVFDSLRSGATGSMRSHNTPLELMFDESPPSLNGASKNKRLSIHEMLVNGGFHDDNSKIVEEDEGMSTPIKPSRLSPEDNAETPIQLGSTAHDDAFHSSPPSFSLVTKDFGRLSLDEEDDDEDWTREDENDLGNQLSPPSSMNSRKVSPSFRAALADLKHNGLMNGNSTPAERPKSNLFDWSEPSSAEKLDCMGNLARPKTAHAQHIVDGRGGRAIGRKGPSPMHVRSQSVPVVPDVAGQREHSKLTPKFGTWGLGAKAVSEDWDNDFDFEGSDVDDMDDGESKMEISGMLVPPAIQASQANVVGHVGQIREVCLLVEDLKRLRLLAKEKNLLDGSSAPLWKEAEGIIALAAPDEEDPTLSGPNSPSSIVFGEDEPDDKYHDRGPDVDDLAIPDPPHEVLNRHGRPTGFVYDGTTVRRRSVFSPDDDIFGAGTLNSSLTREYSQPQPASPIRSSIKSSSEVARSVMETMHQHRATSDPSLMDLVTQPSNKMPFDTTSLRDLVHRANVLSRTLADLIRKSDGRSQSPDVSPHRESSPAFTRVFTDPMNSPPKNLIRTHSNNSVLSGSVNTSPSRNLGQRMHMMTVV